MTEQYDRIDQWRDWGDHTVTIDPIGNTPWIHEGQDGKHLSAAERGRAYDAADVQHLMALMSKQTTEQTNVYVPRWEEVEKVPKFACDVYRGQLRDVRGVGELPVISQQIYYDTLPDLPKGMIERRAYNTRRVISQKVLSKSGVPDHGLPSLTDQQGF